MKANGTDTYYDQMHLAVRLLLQATQEKSELLQFFDSSCPELDLFNKYLLYFQGEFPVQPNSLYADFISTMSFVGTFTGSSKPGNSGPGLPATIDQNLADMVPLMYKISHFCAWWLCAKWHLIAQEFCNGHWLFLQGHFNCCLSHFMPQTLRMSL